MKKEWADKWVKALRSGDYKQCKSTLQRGDAYCCLGVLCKIVPNKLVIFENKKLSGNSLVGQQNVKIFTELKSGNGKRAKQINGIESMLADSLVKLNDEGSTFNEIADIIENEWESL